MELKGKKIAFLGDSITEGCGVSTIENVYWNVLARKTGAEGYGYGIGGTRIARRTEPHNPDFDKNQMTMDVEEDIPTEENNQ